MRFIDPKQGRAWPKTLAAVGGILRALFDVRLRRIVAPRLMPVIYAGLIAGNACIDFHAVILAFDRSRGFGLLCLLIMPVLFIAGVMVVRVGVEMILSIFRIGRNVELLVKQLHIVSGQTETIAGNLPRILFWRCRERRPGSASAGASARKIEIANGERRN